MARWWSPRLCVPCNLALLETSPHSKNKLPALLECEKNSPVPRGVHKMVRIIPLDVQSHIYSQFNHSDSLVEHLLRLREPLLDPSSGLRVVVAHYTGAYFPLSSFPCRSTFQSRRLFSVTTFKVVILSFAFRGTISF